MKIPVAFSEGVWSLRRASVAKRRVFCRAGQLRIKPAILIWPFDWANCSEVLLLVVLRSTIAPASKRIVTASSFPVTAARCSGVLLAQSGAFILTPFATIVFIILLYPESAA